MQTLSDEQKKKILFPDHILNIDGIDTIDDLNFAIFCVVDLFVSKSKLDYDLINSVVGVLECSKFRFVKNISDNYKQNKIYAYGDVFDEEFHCEKI